MNDEGSVIKAALLTRPALTTLTGSGSTARIWPDRNLPIAGYKPNDGIAVGFVMRGGDTLYCGKLMSPRMQFKCWGIDAKTAKQGYLTLCDVLDNRAFGGIRGAYLEGLGQPGEEQDTGWPFVLSFFTIWLAR